MQSLRTEARFAVGSRNGPRSSIWKAWVTGDDAYIGTRLFSNDELKASFHSSGVCQWSAGSKWVLRQPSPRNAVRHFARWQISPANATAATLLFRVEVPVSELRSQPVPKDRKKVFWVGGAPDGSTVRFVFYLTPPAEADPSQAGTLPHQHLFSLCMRSRRWLVACIDIISLSEHDVLSAKAELRMQLRSTGHEPDEDFRSVLFMRANDGNAPNGVLEVCVTEA